MKHIVEGETVMEYEKPQLDPKDADAKKLIKDGQAAAGRGLHRAAGREPPVRVPEGGDQGAEEVANGQESGTGVSVLLSSDP